jgi:hypothetical protein
MERRFVVEAKTFSFMARKGNEIIHLEEKRKGFGGFILLGIKGSGWLADAVEEAMEAQMKEDFARMHRDGARVLKVRLGSNKAGCFLEVAVFVEGGRKGVIRIPEGRRWLGLAKVCGRTAIFGCAAGGEGFAGGSCNQCRRSG